MATKKPTLTLHKKLHLKEWEYGRTYKILAKNEGIRLSKSAYEEGDNMKSLLSMRQAVQTDVPLNKDEQEWFLQIYFINVDNLLRQIANMRRISMKIKRPKALFKERLLATEARIIIRDGLYLIKHHLLKGLGRSKYVCRIFYLKMKAELLYRLIGVNVAWTGTSKYMKTQRQATLRCITAFKLVRKLALRYLVPTSTLRIGLALSMADFFYNILGSVSQADKILGETYLECGRSLIKMMVLITDTSPTFQLLHKMLRSHHRYYYFEHERQKKAAEHDVTQVDTSFDSPLFEQEELDVSVLEGWETMYECTEEDPELSLLGDWEVAVLGYGDESNLEDGEERDASDEIDGNQEYQVVQPPSINFHSMFKYMQVYHKVPPSEPGRRHSI